MSKKRTRAEIAADEDGPEAESTESIEFYIENRLRDYTSDEVEGFVRERFGLDEYSAHRRVSAVLHRMA